MIFTWLMRKLSTEEHRVHLFKPVETLPPYLPQVPHRTYLSSFPPISPRNLKGTQRGLRPKSLLSLESLLSKRELSEPEAEWQTVLGRHGYLNHFIVFMPKSPCAGSLILSVSIVLKFPSLFERKRKKKRERENFYLLVHSPFGLSGSQSTWGWANILELCPVLSHGWQEPKLLGHFALLFQKAALK